MTGSTPMKRSPSALIKAHSRGSFARLILESEQCNGPISMNAAQYGFVFRFIQFIVFLCRLVTPVAYVSILSLGFAYYRHGSRPQCASTESVLGLSWFPFPLPNQLPDAVYQYLPSWLYTILVLWAIAEVLFFPYYWYMFKKLHVLNDSMQHIAVDKDTRRKLMLDCFEAVYVSGLEIEGQAPEQTIRKMIEGWFLDIPLIQVHFGNMAQWTAWAFFCKDVKEMSIEEVTENNEIVHYIETVAKWRFPPGFNNDIHALRLDLDPIFATQRPFIFYFCIGLMNYLFHIVIVKWLLGFKYLRKFTSPSKGQHVYLRRGKYTDSNSNSDSNTNTSNDSNKQPKLPIVFMHGIGIGFAHYIGILLSLPRDVDVFLIEWPYVAMQMSTNAPTAEESIACIDNVLDYFHHDKAVFLAHSLGTVLISWLLHHPITAKRVAHSILIDPIIFLLCEPTVASVFVYKDPQHWIDLLMHFFLSRELFISNALSRHFSWSYNIMFIEELMNNKSCCNYHHVNKPSNVTSKSNTGELNRFESSYYSHYASNTIKKPNTTSTGSSKHSGKGILRNTSTSNVNDNSKGESDSNIKTLHRTDSEIRLKQHSCPLLHNQIEHTIILSSHDNIVPVGPVSRYLDYKSKHANICNYEVWRFYGYHGEIMIHPSWVKRIMDKVKYYSTHHYDLLSKDRQQTTISTTSTSTSIAPSHDTRVPSEENVSAMWGERESGGSSKFSSFPGSNNGSSKLLRTGSSRGFASLGSFGSLNALGIRSRNHSSANMMANGGVGVGGNDYDNRSDGGYSSSGILID